ncbi:MAG: hypothetical protein IBX57_00125 [Gammaproteobacteria bacterium]|nr:hypothetical protein [Gammaproteobacteria bacterium]
MPKIFIVEYDDIQHGIDIVRSVMYADTPRGDPYIEHEVRVELELILNFILGLHFCYMDERAIKSKEYYHSCKAILENLLDKQIYRFLSDQPLKKIDLTPNNLLLFKLEEDQ